MTGDGRAGDETAALGGATPGSREGQRTATMPLLGRRLGEFVLVGHLGEGGFGAVYRAEQPALGREAVVKILHARHRERADWSKRFLREAQLASRLEHPYAAHVYAFGAESDGLLWIAMELVRGTPLDRLLANGALSLARFVPLLERICEVVHTAHEQGIVHRDLKPANVMVLSRAGRLLPKLLDFGIAKLADVETHEPGMTAEGPLSSRETIDVASSDTPSRVEGPAITRQGVVVGSPLYMAPEQWRDSSQATSRTDIYALAVLAWECLAGHVPFRGQSVAELEHEHAVAPVPPLPPPLPAALSEVVTRAMAKRPEDRYATALELARAVRAAARLDVEHETLPQLDDTIRQTVVARWPQPIAEAVAALEAVRNLHQARDAIGDVVRSVVRWIGVLALAAHTQGGGAAPERARELLRALGTREPSDEEWRDLAVEMLRPHQRAAAAHALPALVAVFAQGDPFAPLFALRAQDAGAPTTLEDPIRTLVTRAYDELAGLLTAVRFLGEHQVVVVRGPLGEIWSGVRRPRRAMMLLPLGLEEADGGVVVLGDEDVPILRLSPLVQVAPPHPGAPEEAFLLAGASARGARMVALPAGFERTDPELRQWLAEELLAEEGGAEPGVAADASPYLGLTPFSTADADRYFGREAEVEAVLNRLRVQPLIAVVGPSGAGKSSFVHAGIVPRLPAGTRVAVLRPGPAPLAALAAAPPADLVVVDQLEELITMCPDEDERRRFAAALVALPRVIVTLRDDFLGRVQALPALRERLATSLELLAVPGPEQLRRALVEPARRAGHRFEDDRLADEMVAAVADLPNALPLLSFAAAELWERRDRHFRLLTRRAHDQLGGVAGALAAHAEAVLAQMPVADRERVRAAFRSLLTAEGTRAVLERDELVHVLGGGERAAGVIDQLVAARLLVAGEGAGGRERVEVVHEALATAWPRLVEWRRADVAGARLRDQLRDAARQWDERGRARGLLWRDDALAELRRFRAAWSAPLTPLEEEFFGASEGDFRLGRRRRLVALIAAFSVLGAALAVLGWQRSVAQRFADESRARLLASYEEQGRQALLDDDPLRALAFLSEARFAGLDTPELGFLLAEAARPLERERFVLRQEGTIFGMDFSPDAQILVGVGDDGIHGWDVATGAARFHLAERSTRVEFSPAGDRFATATGAQALILGIGDGTPRLRLDAGKPTALAFSPDGEHLATVGGDLTVKVWNATSGALERTSPAHPARVRLLAFSADGAALASADTKGEIHVWREDGTLAVLQHGGLVNVLGFLPEGTLLSAGEAGAVIWSLPDGARQLVYAAHGRSTILAAGWAPDGRWLATAAEDGALHIWERDGTPRCSLAAHRGQAIGLVVAGDARVITAGDDRNAFAWDARHCRRIATFAGHTARLMRAQVAPGGAILGTSAVDGTLRLWDLTSLPAPPLEGIGEGATTYLRASPDGRALAAASGKGVVLVDLASRTPRALPHPRPALRLDFSASGKYLVTGATDGHLRTWDPARAELVRDVATGGEEVQSVAAHPTDDETTALVTGPASRGRTSRVGDTGFRVQIWAGDVRQLDLARPVLAVTYWDERRLVAAGADGSIEILEAPAGGEVTRWPAHRLPALGLASVGPLLATGGGDASVFLWSQDGTRTRVGTHDGEITALALHPRLPLLAIIDSESQLTLWSTSSGMLLGRQPFAMGSGVSFSPDGRTLWIVADGVVWEQPLSATPSLEALHALRRRLPADIVVR